MRTVYEHDYGYPQHEHLYCQQCGKMIEFQRAAIVAIIDEVCRQQSFRSTRAYLDRLAVCRVQSGSGDETLFRPGLVAAMG